MPSRILAAVSGDLAGATLVGSPVAVELELTSCRSIVLKRVVILGYSLLMGLTICACVLAGSTWLADLA